MSLTRAGIVQMGGEGEKTSTDETVFLTLPHLRRSCSHPPRHQPTEDGSSPAHDQTIAASTRSARAGPPSRPGKSRKEGKVQRQRQACPAPLRV